MFLALNSVNVYVYEGQSYSIVYTESVLSLTAILHPNGVTVCRRHSITTDCSNVTLK